MAGYPVAGLDLYPLIKSSIDRLINVENATAMVAPEVVMILGIAIESTQIAGQVQLQDLPLFLHRLEIAIDSSQTDVWYLFLCLLIDPISRWMGFGVLQNPYYGFSLFGLPLHT